MGESLDIAFYRYSLLNRGGDRMVVEYANHLADIGHRVTLYTSVDSTVFHVSSKIIRKKIPWPGRAGFLAWTSVCRLRHAITIVDIIHLTPLLRPRGHLVYFAQADDVEYYGRAFSRWVVDKLYHRFFRKNGFCIAVYEHLTEAFRQRYGARNCFTVVNGIDLGIFHHEPDRELLAAKGKRRAIFFMSRGDHYRKGYDLALQVFARLSGEIADRIELWVCGDPLDGDFSFPVRQFGVVDDSRLRQILSSVDIFFYPSRHEGFGLFPLEAMACGSVVVTTDAVPYARDYGCIHQTAIGDVDAMAREIVGLINDPERLDADRREGLAVAARYDLQRSCHAFANVLESLPGGDRAHRD